MFPQNLNVPQAPLVSWLVFVTLRPMRFYVRIVHIPQLNSNYGTVHTQCFKLKPTKRDLSKKAILSWPEKSAARLLVS